MLTEINALLDPFCFGILAHKRYRDKLSNHGRRLTFITIKNAPLSVWFRYCLRKNQDNSR